MGLMEIRRSILQNEDGLPPAYQRLSCIVNPGWAFLRPGYEPVIGDEIDIEYTWDTKEETYSCLFSAGTSTYQLIALQSEGTYMYCRYFTSDSAQNLAAKHSFGTWYRMTVSASGVFNANGATVTSTPNGEINGTDKRLWIFRRANGSSPWQGKLRAFKLSNNGILKLNFIPCKSRSTGDVGVYDTVSKQFFKSASATDRFYEP